MFSQPVSSFVRCIARTRAAACFVIAIAFIVGAAAAFGPGAHAQGYTSVAVKGLVRDQATGTSIPGATVVLTNQNFGTKVVAITDSSGTYFKTSLPAGDYEIEVSANGYVTQKRMQPLYTMTNNTVNPDPVDLVAVQAVVSPTPTVPTDPVTTPTPGSTPAPATGDDTAKESLSIDARRVGVFGRDLVVGLPLGSSTLTRTFDELAFLVPGVNPPPQAIGNSVGPGVGGGVGTSGQFSVNGQRSRANNFTVDGSDNNDEDIGVRRQGFFSLVPQPIESIQEFQITTLLAPAEFGRNLGAQVNAVSRSGANGFHGSLFGFLNADELNDRNFFDNTGGNTAIDLTSNGTSGGRRVFVDGVQRREFNTAGDEDEFALFQGGGVLGGPIVRNKAFFFVSAEFQDMDGTRERNFAVPTVDQRSLFGASAGLQACLGTPVNGVCDVNFTPIFPTSVGGDAIFSLFPFANNPTGIYGANTYTRALSTDAKGVIFSARADWNIFKVNGNQQTFTGRYNYTDDERDLTDVAGALFSQIRPLVRTDNFSTFLNGSLTPRVSNEFRFSWGRTRLRFDELPDETGFLRPVSEATITSARDRRFLLNAPLLLNSTLPGPCTTTGCFGAVRSDYTTTVGTTAQSRLGPVGQVIIAGFSPLGVDVFNFPQERQNDTFQFADTVRWQAGRHGIAFGADIRRVSLDSDLPRNSRPLVTFNGAPCIPVGGVCNNPYIIPTDLAAAGAATGFFQSLVLPGLDARIELQYNQLDFFIQDEWRPRSNVAVNVGLRYEYNTVPHEKDNKIENTFLTPRDQYPVIPAVPNGFPGLDTFVGFNAFLNGRTDIYDADKNNFAPRVGIAWSINDDTVIRGGYGLYYDQILGAVVSQSRNVFPTFTTLNTAGGENCGDNRFRFLNPITGTYSPTSCDPNAPDRFRLVAPGSLNVLNPQFDRLQLLNALLREFPRVNGTFFGATIPSRDLPSPMSHQYSIGFERRIAENTFVSAAYVGTLGRNLLRFTTPNLGSNYIGLITGFEAGQCVQPNPNEPPLFCEPFALGTTVDPFSNSDLTRPNRDIGPISQFETTGRSHYDSLQLGLRGNWRNTFQYNVNYVYGSVKDDVSDAFDLAGASALPQNSLTFAGEYAPANFDVRHRFTYDMIYGLPKLRDRNHIIRHVFGGWEIASTGKFNTGQPFTVNSIFDVNLDGNLTDRLNTTQGIRVTGDRQQPLQLTVADPTSLLAPLGTDGSVPRNSFRAGNILDLDFALSRRFRFTESQDLQFRVDFFNFINRANFGIPVRFLEAPGFGRAVDTVTPGRRIQFGLKYNF